MAVRKFIQKLQPIIYPVIQWYFKKPRWITKRGIRIKLAPSVFHPSLYHSTDVMLDFIISKSLSNRKVLELGCGSGFISMYLAEKTNAQVYASDINFHAVAALRGNLKQANLSIEVFHSDLFQNLPDIHFDVILINPPYYFANPVTPDQYAFYVGKDGNYFARLFEGLIPYLENGTMVVLVVSEDVELRIMSAFSLPHGIHLIEKLRRRCWGEDFIIYQAAMA